MSDGLPSLLDYLRDDSFAASLGIEIEAVEPGYARVSVVVTQAMTNFHGTTHGGLIFTLADMALAAASNSHGQTAFALNVSMTYLRATAAGTKLVAEGREKHAGGPTAVYDITVAEQATGELVATAQAIAYRKRESFLGAAGER
jgi:acyl-CoA thioesterase